MATKKFYVMSADEQGGYPVCWGSYESEQEAWDAAVVIGWREGVNCWVEG